MQPDNANGPQHIVVTEILEELLLRRSLRLQNDSNAGFVGSAVHRARGRLWSWSP